MCLAPAPCKHGRHGKAAESKRPVFCHLVSGAGMLPVKDQGVNVWLCDHSASVQRGGGKAVADDVLMNACGWVSIKLYLQR